MKGLSWDARPWMKRRRPEGQNCAVVGYCTFCEEGECLLESAQAIFELIHCPSCGLFAKAWTLDQGPWTLEDGTDVHAVHALYCEDCEILWITTERLSDEEVPDHIVLEVEL